MLDLVAFSLIVNGVLWFFLEGRHLGKNQGITLVGVFAFYMLSLLMAELIS